MSMDYPSRCEDHMNDCRCEICHQVNPDVGCAHDWHEPVDSQFCNEKYTEVKCTKCGMVGEKTIATGEVDFPAT